ncbi:MAG: response regulator transcription factor [Bdellovibrionaceae bacterium]|nr:response regulator transcription factor [Pseudobdellovibrionaceae bacterium]
MKLLLIEDDKRLSEHLTQNLKDHGFLALNLYTNDEISNILKSNLVFDFILMDRLLNNFDTKTILPLLRQKWPSAPIIVLSAINSPNERTDVINLGADDYIGKPFSSQELIARMKALLRRSANPVGNYIHVGNVVIDFMGRVISVGSKTENLPSREFTVLRTLAIDPNRIWSKDDLLDYVWGHTAHVETNVVESTIANIRKKLEELGATITIKNLRNAGYWIAK